MPSFSYSGKNSQGQTVSGTVEANDRPAAIRQIEQQRITPIRVSIASTPAPAKKEPDPAPTPANPARSKTSAAPLVNKSPSAPPASVEISTMSHTQLHLFTEQLALLLNAGITLDEGLGILVKRMKHPKLHALAKELHQSLVEGRSLSQALKSFPKIFEPLYVNMVAAGEASGTIGEILKRLVAYLADLKALRDRVQQALLYPAILVVVGIGMVTLFMTVMVPKLMKFFLDSNMQLPFATRVLQGTYTFLQSYWWLIALAIAGAFSGFKAWTKAPAGRAQWDRTRWSLPLVGGVLRGRYYAQFARTLATLMSNGVTLLKALELLQDISGNLFVAKKMHDVRLAVSDGTPLSAALARQNLFPELFLDMLSIGEQSGRLAETLNNVADVYERELDKTVKTISTLVPPLVMVGIAVNRRRRRFRGLRNPQRRLRDDRKPPTWRKITPLLAVLSPSSPPRNPHRPQFRYSSSDERSAQSPSCSRSQPDSPRDSNPV
jgi:type II secretory pathway component PulF